MVERGVNENPSVKAETWFALAIASMIIAVVLMVIIASWVFSGENAAEVVQRSQSFTPFGAALLAIVTFLTVAWRGVLNTRQLEHQASQLKLQTQQLDHQAEQIDLQVRQFELQTKQIELQTRQVEQQIRANDAGDQANLARLLQEGAKLLGEKEKEPQIIGGIVTLETLVMDQTKFSVPAMNLLLDFIERSHATVNLQSAVLSAREVMARGAKKGVRSSFTANFRTNDAKYEWFGIRGAVRAEYWGGAIEHYGYSDIDGDGWFNDVSLSHCRIKGPWSYVGCTFTNCDFSDMEMPVAINCNYTGCLFSGTKFARDDMTTFHEGNVYIDGNPPQGHESKWRGIVLPTNDVPDWKSGIAFLRFSQLHHI
jgi:uncharacterized protein YjbI with pentapeptide repeats